MRYEFLTTRGIFGLYLDCGSLLAPHFYIKCSCRGKNGDGMYSGSRLDREGIVRDDKCEKSFNYTFYRGHDLFLDQIEMQQSLSLICNDCNQKFNFDVGSYNKIIKKICEQI